MEGDCEEHPSLAKLAHSQGPLGTCQVLLWDQAPGCDWKKSWRLLTLIPARGPLAKAGCQTRRNKHQPQQASWPAHADPSGLATSLATKFLPHAHSLDGTWATGKNKPLHTAADTWPRRATRSAEEETVLTQAGKTLASAAARGGSTLDCLRSPPPPPSGVVLVGSGQEDGAWLEKEGGGVSTTVGYRLQRGRGRGKPPPPPPAAPAPWEPTITTCHHGTELAGSNRV